MSINKTRCRKCNGSAFFMKPHNNNTGLYCGDCGAWQKWLNKDEINAWKHYFEQLDEMQISKEEKEIDQMVSQYITDNSKPTGVNFYDESTIVERFDKLVQWINRELDKEHNEVHLSNSDFTRSMAYCFGLSKVKVGIENVLAGREFDEY